MVRAKAQGDEEKLTLKDLLSSVDRVLIVGHHNADPDALCAMIAFERLYHAIQPDGVVTLACEDVSKLATQVVNTFIPLPEISDTADGEYDLIVMLDTNNAYQLGPALEQIVDTPEKTLVIDHHELNPDIDSLASHQIIDSDRSSTCEILVTLFHELELDMPVEVANLLLAGILFDTRRFFYACPQTFHTTISLIEAGADYNLCLRSLIVRPDRSERIARLRAASRLRVHLIGEWIVVTAKTGAFEASACRAFLELGADVAIVGGRPSSNTVRLSSRSTKEFYAVTGINLGKDIMEPLGPIIGGEGGGHPNAGGANGTKNRDHALNKAVELLREAIKRASVEKIVSP